MKRRIIVLILAAIMLLCTSVFAVIGCGSDGETDGGNGDSDENKLEYGITVLAPDRSPIEGVVVSWQQSGATKGSATTDADGKATVKLVAGEYTVALSELYAGYANPQGVTVNAEMREVSLKLQTVKVTYTAEVKDKHGAAASGVKVSWTNGGKIETKTTGADGKASCELDYGDYTVTISDLPEDNIFTDSISVTGDQPGAIFELRDGKPVEYTVSVRSAGGLKITGVTVYVYNNNVPIYTGETDNDGELKFSQAPGNYTADVPAPQDGYDVTKKAQLAENVLQSEIVLTSSVRESMPPKPDGNNFYKIGDIIHDYEWTTPYEVNGRKVTYSISEILEEKQAVIINNWGTKCSFCVKEMPAMQEAYAKYKDDIELLAISNYNGGDPESTIIDFHDSNTGYTFPMMRDYNDFVYRFNITGHPTTIVVDRYGAIAHIETGAVTNTEVWERLIARYVGDNYVQTFVPGKDSTPITEEVSKPDITVPADHYEKVAKAINKFDANANTYVEWYGETQNEYYWPFILKTEDGVSETDEVLCSSNSGKPNSVSALYARVKMPAGKVLAFDCYYHTETNIDILSAVWDGKMIIKEISGKSNGWETCYLYAELDGQEHYLALSYAKDNSTDIGVDNVYIRNVRFEDISSITESMDMPRYATYGTGADVELINGYYHIKRDSLQNGAHAGLDEKPMLLANLIGSTKWNGRTAIVDLLYETTSDERYKYSCLFSINGGEARDYRNYLINYCRVAQASDVAGCVPVDEELRAVLVEFIAVVEGKAARNNSWLELCYFFSHYGDGEFIGNPIIGLTTQTAIAVEEDAQTTASLTRAMAPFPTLIYSFTPSESAVYKIESLLPADSEQAAQVWLYDDATDPEKPLVYDGDERMVRDGVNEHNFVVYRYLEADHTYYIEVAYLMQEMGNLDFKVTKVGQSATELVPCSSNSFIAILGSDGESIVGYELAGAVNYYKDDEGYYRVGDENDKHADDPYIYLDVKYPTAVSISFTRLAEQKVKVPFQDRYCNFMSFDFRYRIAYAYELNGNEDPTLIGYIENYDLTKDGYGLQNREYKDYTDILKGYINQSKNSDGLVKVNDEIKDMLTLFIETRVNPLNVYDDGTIEYDAAQANEWLRLCWYHYTHNADNH